MVIGCVKLWMDVVEIMMMSMSRVMMVNLWLRRMCC